jgi:acyl carrier protein
MPESLTAQTDINLERRVLRCVTDTQHLDPSRVSLDSTFEELEIDSLAGINILFAVESEFGITVPDDQAQQVRTVRQLVDGVRALVNGAAPKPK